MLKQVLKEKFGYDHFRLGQEETITAILNHQNTFAILPTGTGKSLCYQLPSYLLNSGLTIIISPLLALMYDQVNQIQKRGEKSVVALTSEQTAQEQQYILQHLQTYRYLFLSPEMLMKEQVLATLKKVDIALFVVDEAHCITQWGLDFRPEYRKLGTILEQLHYPKTLALTATVTAEDQAEISQILFAEEPQLITTTVNRDNIIYQVIETTEKDQFLVDFLRTYQGPGIIYFSSKKQAERVALYLKQQLNLKVAAYHADLTSQDRRSLQDQFINQQLEILCATTAFGMGINKANIRFVIHYHMPASLEAFMQESGRSGRDGKLALSILLYQEGDEFIQRNLLSDMWQQYQTLETMKQLDQLSELQQKWQQYYPHKEQLQKLIESKYQQKQLQIKQVKQYIQAKNCRRAQLLTYFDEEVLEHTEHCCDLTEINYDQILLPREQVLKDAVFFDSRKKIEHLFKINLKSSEVQ